MDIASGLNSLRDETAMTSRSGKQAIARRNQAGAQLQGTFDTMLAGLQTSQPTLPVTTTPQQLPAEATTTNASVTAPASQTTATTEVNTASDGNAQVGSAQLAQGTSGVLVMQSAASVTSAPSIQGIETDQSAASVKSAQIASGVQVAQSIQGALTATGTQIALGAETAQIAPNVQSAQSALTAINAQITPNDQSAHMAPNVENSLIAAKSQITLNDQNTQMVPNVENTLTAAKAQITPNDQSAHMVPNVENTLTAANAQITPNDQSVQVAPNAQSAVTATSAQNLPNAANASTAQIALSDQNAQITPTAQTSDANYASAPANAQTSKAPVLATQAPDGQVVQPQLVASAEGLPTITSTQTDVEILSAQLASLGVDESNVGQSATPSPTAVTTAATTNLPTPDARLAPAKGEVVTAPTPTDEEASAAPTSAPAISSVVAQTATTQAGTPQIAAKAKSLEIADQAKPISTAISEPSTPRDSAGTTPLVSGHEATTPTTDQASRAPQLTPQTVPMLAATMMRRFDSGSRQFTMRLDPPELGQVEVKLTVTPDKKVRAVVSADRPEALADLVRSARELVRALNEAGLDLDENGMTFQMNDPSSGGRQQDGRDGHKSHEANLLAKLAPANTNEPDSLNSKFDKPSDPFERWQRARVALTA